MRGIILLWERCRMLCICGAKVAVGGGERGEGYQAPLEKSLESARITKLLHSWVGWCNKLCFIILVIIAWRRCLLPSSSTPHQAGLAYAILDTTVALVTSHRWGPLSPWATSVLTAYKLWLHWVTICSTCPWTRNPPHTTPPEFSCYWPFRSQVPGAGCHSTLFWGASQSFPLF